MDDGKYIAARNGMILNVLVKKIDVREFRDGKHNSKLADKVSIDLRHSF